MKLHEVIAVLANRKKKLLESMSEAMKIFKQTGVFDGLIRKYTPKNEEGERFPDESQKIKQSVDGVLSNVIEDWISAVDCVATVDVGNTLAKTDLIIDGKTIASGVPATTLIYLEKQLTDWITLLESVPVLDPSLNWSFDSEAKMFKSEVIKTNRTKKVQKPIVLYPATEQHPAQAQLITEDENVGMWEAQKTSQALPFPRKQQLLTKLDAARNAVIAAREVANSQECTQFKLGRSLLGHIFGSEQ